MRMVRLAIEYDMDDTEKLLSHELDDWLNGDITVQDLFNPNGTVVDGNDRIYIRELDSQGEVK